MRLSTIEGDPGYSEWRRAIESGGTVKVFLDGVEITHCLTADTDHGLVQRCVLDEDGKPQLDPSDPDKIWDERVTGDVSIEITVL